MTRPAVPQTTERRSRWIPWLFPAGFVIVLAANGAMLTAAITTFPGLDTENHYERGLAYNRTLAEVAAQREAGWRSDLRFTQTGAGHGRLDLTLQDRDAAPLSGMAVEAQLVRPTQTGHDLTVRLDPVAPGRYAGVVDLPLSGQWEVRLQASGEPGVFRQVERVMIR